MNHEVNRGATIGNAVRQYEKIWKNLLKIKKVVDNCLINRYNKFVEYSN